MHYMRASYSQGSHKGSLMHEGLIKGLLCTRVSYAQGSLIHEGLLCTRVSYAGGCLMHGKVL